MKYHLTEDWVKANDVLVQYLLKTGILEEVKEIYASPSLGITNTPSLRNVSTTEMKEEEWPKASYKYWYVSSKGTVHSEVWYDTSPHLNRKKTGNCFHTKEEALEASEKIKALLLSLKK